MKHQWEGGMTVDTPDNPAEGYSYCDLCGVEETDDNRHDDCPIQCATCGDTGEIVREYGSPVDTEPTQVTEPCPDCGGNFP